MAKKEKGKLGQNANYGFQQHAPKTPMGNGSFANLPLEPFFTDLSGKWDMRDGIRNGPVTTVNEVSQVVENMRGNGGNDKA